MASIACFISSHGFGHATRTAAILEQLRALRPHLDIIIVSAVPQRIFAETLEGFTHHPIDVDIGLVQRSALAVDYPATIAKLSALLPYRRSGTTSLSDLCRGCSLILCDISPWGVVVGEELGIPSVLVESFTWDFIYAPAIRSFPQLEQYAAYMRAITERASYRIQTEPLCVVHPCDLRCGPIFRRQRADRHTTRQLLSGDFHKIVLVTLGGINQAVPSLPYHHHPDLLFIFAGQESTIRVADNLLLLGQETHIYHPDLLAAVDLVVCKSGYSTLAECCQAGVRLIAIGREDFPESPILQRYAEEHLGGIALTPSAYLSGAWLELLEGALASPAPQPLPENGAEKVANFLLRLL